MNRFTFREYADIHFMYGLADGNSRLASRLYAERFPHRRPPCHQVFSLIHTNLGDSGKFLKDCVEREKTVRTVDFEDQVLHAVEENPSVSVRCIAHRLNAHKSTVWRVLHEDLLYPFKLQKVQALEPGDFPLRMDCARWFLHKVVDSPNFLRKVFFTDEASFTREGIFNTRNNHVWAFENPHAIVQRKFQHKFSVNVWAGIIDGHLIGPYILPDKLNGPTYLVFLRDILPELLENVPIQLRRRMWFQHDGAPAHFSNIVREYLNVVFRNRWIGRGGPIPWPPRSPDLTPIDFCLWGHMKQLVYATPVTDPMDLVARIVEAAATIQESDIFEKVRESSLKRYRLCNEVRGRHFEQLL